MLGELALHVVGVRVGLVDLVQRDDHRHARGLEVRDRLDRLRLDAIVRGDDEDRDVSDLRATGAHRRERLVTRGVQERDLPTTVLDLIRADVLGDAAGLAGRHVRLTDRVQEARLAVVDMADDRHDRRSRDHLGQVVVGPEDLLPDGGQLLGLLDLGGQLLFGNDLHPELARDERRGLEIDGLVDRGHDAHVHEGADDVDDRDVKGLRELADLQRLGQRDRGAADREDGNGDRRDRHRHRHDGAAPGAAAGARSTLRREPPWSGLRHYVLLFSAPAASSSRNRSLVVSSIVSARARPSEPSAMPRVRHASSGQRYAPRPGALPRRSTESRPSASRTTRMRSRFALT